MKNEQRTEALRMLAWLGKQVQDLGLDQDLILGRSSHGWHGGVYRTSGEFRPPKRGEFFLTTQGRVARCYAEGLRYPILERLWPQDEPETPADTLDTPEASASAPAMTVHEIGAAEEYRLIGDWFGGKD